jgi:hypothetical protein
VVSSVGSPAAELPVRCRLIDGCGIPWEATVAPTGAQPAADPISTALPPAFPAPAERVTVNRMTRF